MLSLVRKIQKYIFRRLKAKRSCLKTKFELLNLPAEAGGELLKVDDTIVVLVDLAEQVDAVLLEVGVVDGGFLNLGQDVLDVLLGEHFRVVLHVLLGVLVRAHKLEAETTQKDGTADQEILLSVVSTRDGVLVVLAIHELATDASTILVAHFIDEDGIIATEERDDELAVFVIRLR